MTPYLPEKFLALSKSSFSNLIPENAPVWQGLVEIGAWLSQAKELGRIEGTVSKNAFLENESQIYIGKGAVVEAGAFIRGPCWLGEGVCVRHGAYLRGNVMADKGAVIGHDTEVKNALFLEGAHAAHFAYVGDALLGAGVNLGAGVKLANLKLSGKEIFIDGKSTGLRKFGAVIGDGTQIGCNAVLNPGTLIGRHSEIFPLVSVHGVIPESSRVEANLSIVVRPKT